MASAIDSSSVKVYTVNGAPSASSSALPDWLTRKRQQNGSKRTRTEHIEGTIELVQHFEFPEASNRIRTTRDGHFAVATGTYKPQMRVFDLDQLALKFERHSEAENVDFLILSDDWTKTAHLQSDRTIELHNQSGFYYRTRIPRFGRAIAYHSASCDLLAGGSGSDVFRLNLDEGRFMMPLDLSEGGADFEGVNAIDINPAHQLFAFGTSGNGTVQFWDPRSRSRVGILRIPLSQLLPTGGLGSTGMDTDPAVTALSSRMDGLNLAVGTSSGHTLLYDLRSDKPYAMKDQGYGLPVQSVAWIEGGHKMASENLVVSADKKVLKIWDRNTPGTNFTSVTPANDINHVHHLPGSGLLMLANEGIQMTTLYIPQLGPALKWCSFLDNITEEMEEQSTRNVYEDFKFVERSELSSLGLDHLVGTPALKPYMHGYFVSAELYSTARLIANPYAYAEHRERLVQEKLEKLADTRIRARKDIPGVKVNKSLAERLRKSEEKAARKAKTEGGKPEKGELASDPRFKELFENPEYEIDENSREFTLINPSTAAQKAKFRRDEDESESEEEAPEDGDDDVDMSEESSEEDYPPARQKEQIKATSTNPIAKTSSRPSSGRRLVSSFSRFGTSRTSDTGATLGQLRRTSSSHTPKARQVVSRGPAVSNARATADGGLEMSFIPSSSGAEKGGRGQQHGKAKGKKPEMFGAGLQKGAGEEEDRDIGRGGRTKRRTGVRSGSKNFFRRN
ncbi:WD40 repeat-like protein [Dacryopinax primogenitus]|uniref:WD40 repeat-like protein n=1 Tax=Dacryopinax primogenitus (strain DJM 731) TaxID=1858805 RepID=M5G6F6_DACPD|nr:WD40 repeat-like protein [Dacryopinax primogenitus]EJT99347.1 WD40 repeat-like protein [Dacryopinax primogenitus]